MTISERPAVSSGRLSVHNPAGYPPKVTRKSMALRLDALDGSTVYLFECRFDESIELLKDLQLSQNYIYPRATFGELLAGNLAAPPEQLVHVWQAKDINVVVVGSESNGYWQMMGASYRKTVSIDEWR